MQRHHWIAIGVLVIIGIALFVALLFFTAPAAVAPTEQTPAQSASSNLDSETLRVAKSLYCPVCPGVPLDTCETQACQQWRALIRQKLSEGETPQQIEAYFVDQYGERVLGAPRPEGVNLAIYALPVAAVVGGGALVYLAARRWVKPRGGVSDPPPAASQDPYRERVERDLREYE